MKQKREINPNERSFITLVQKTFTYSKDTRFKYTIAAHILASTGTGWSQIDDVQAVDSVRAGGVGAYDLEQSMISYNPKKYPSTYVEVRATGRFTAEYSVALSGSIGNGIFYEVGATAEGKVLYATPLVSNSAKFVYGN